MFGKQTGMTFHPISKTGDAMIERLAVRKTRKTTLDTAAGDPIETIFDWGNLRLLSADSSRGRALFVAVDANDIECGSAEGGAVSQAEVGAWIDMHGLAGKIVRPLGEFQRCPDCDLNTAFIPRGPLLGHGYCSSCNAWEGGYLFVETFEPMNAMWPRPLSFSTHQDFGEWRFDITLMGEGMKLTGYGSTLTEADDDAYAEYLRLTT